jgi:hypothetical protein
MSLLSKFKSSVRKSALAFPDLKGKTPRTSVLAQKISPLHVRREDATLPDVNFGDPAFKNITKLNPFKTNGRQSKFDVNGGKTPTKYSNTPKG